MFVRIVNGVINRVNSVLPVAINDLFIKYIPFSFRWGREYDHFIDKIEESKYWNEQELKDYVVFNFDKIFQYSKNFKFYREKYEKSGVLDLRVKTISDIEKIPILSRSEIRKNVHSFSGRYLEKTGGTSGNPLKLYLDKNIWAREWAHYHKIYARKGFNYTQKKFIVKRQNLKDQFIEFDFCHNNYNINTYKITDENLDIFFKILISNNVQYFNGFPSSIFDFLKEIETRSSKEQKSFLKNQIKCCFFMSEMPLPHILKYVKNVWKFDFITCYGHTEACVLAQSGINNLKYMPLHTYGYLEEQENMLLGTSFHNFDMPLIRYNTDDLIESEKDSNGIVKFFKIKKGRVLDYFINKIDLKVYYLDLFYETDGEIFEYIDYFQFYQKEKGEVTFLISQKQPERVDIPALLNLEKFYVDYDFIYLKEPVRTASGKVPLKISEIPSFTN